MLLQEFLALNIKRRTKMSWDPFVRFILPDSLFNYFEMSDFKYASREIHISLEELNNTPEEYKKDKLESKSFYEEIKMHDYPLRGRSCIIHIKQLEAQYKNHLSEYKSWNQQAHATE